MLLPSSPQHSHAEILTHTHTHTRDGVRRRRFWEVLGDRGGALTGGMSALIP